MAKKHQHFVLFKPDGYLSQFVINEPRGHRKKLLGELYDFPEGIMPVGRLDEASEGLLLLTTNGKLSHHINSSDIEKEYYAQVDGVITDKAIAELTGGLDLSDEGTPYISQKCKARKIPVPQLPNRQKRIRGDHHGPTSWISITLTEGKNRQVRKMTATVGFPTLRLIRVRIGNLKIKNMQPGEVQEIADLREIENDLPSDN